MSQENVEIVRQVYEALSHRDTDAVVALYDPEVEFHFSPETIAIVQPDRFAGPRVYRGHAGLREFDSELREAFTDFETKCEELIDAGEHVVSVSRYRGRGRGSGVEVEGPGQFGVWTIRGSKVVCVLWFSSREAALEAAGLSE
jgi:ketosteroid isomerase-like protein